MMQRAAAPGAVEVPVAQKQATVAAPCSTSLLPKASVIIVNYNGRQHLQNCLPSLLPEQHPDYDIIVVDNASTDGSAEYVDQAFPHVQLIRNESNLGFGQGGNVGARQARGRYLAFLNPDTVVERHWLAELVAAVEDDPQTGLATSKILLLADPERINTCGNEMHFTGLTLCRGMGMDRRALADLQEVSAVSGAAFVIRRDLFEQLGGFDGSFFLYMEDTDLSWRARLAGYRCVCVPSSLVFHDYSLRFGPKKTFYQERNRYLLLLKGLRWRTFLVLLPALLLVEVVTWGFVLLREPQRLANKLRAYAWVLLNWRQVLQSRQKTQALRLVRDRDLLAQCEWRLAYEQTGSGLVGRLAHIVFDPLFFILFKLALAVIRW